MAGSDLPQRSVAALRCDAAPPRGRCARNVFPVDESEAHAPDPVSHPASPHAPSPLVVAGRRRGARAALRRLGGISARPEFGRDGRPRGDRCRRGGLEVAYLRLRGCEPTHLLVWSDARSLSRHRVVPHAFARSARRTSEGDDGELLRRNRSLGPGGCSHSVPGDQSRGYEVRLGRIRVAQRRPRRVRRISGRLDRQLGVSRAQGHTFARLGPVLRPACSSPASAAICSAAISASACPTGRPAGFGRRGRFRIGTSGRSPAATEVLRSFVTSTSTAEPLSRPNWNA
jgi:hypothetical protein